jgi:hypothetical protein
MRTGGPGRIAFVTTILTFAAWAAAFAATGGVHVSTLPGGADVWIDGTYVGRSPLVVEGLGQGRHTLTITKAGWTSQELPIDVPAGSIAMTGVLLSASGSKSAKGMGTLVIRKAPAGELSIDGRRIASDARELPLAPGVHRLTVVPEHGSPEAQNVEIFPETATALAFLDAAPVSERAAVIAQASDYLPDGSYNVAGGRFTVRYGGHEVVGVIGTPVMRFDGVTVAYDSVPAIIGGRLYLPLAFLEKLTGKSAKAR